MTSNPRRGSSTRAGKDLDPTSGPASAVAVAICSLLDTEVEASGRGPRGHCVGKVTGALERATRKSAKGRRPAESIDDGLRRMLEGAGWPALADRRINLFCRETKMQTFVGSAVLILLGRVRRRAAHGGAPREAQQG